MPANLLELRHFPNPRPALSESADLAGSQQGFEARRDDNRPIGDPAYKDTPPNEAAATRVGIDLTLPSTNPKPSGDDDLHDLVGPCIDGLNCGIRIIVGYRILVHEPIPPKKKSCRHSAETLSYRSEAHHLAMLTSVSMFSLST